VHYEEALSHAIFRYVSGSHAYGTQREDGSSDEDIRGVFIAPLHYAFDLFNSSFVGSGTIAQRLKGALGDIADGNYASAAEQIRQAQDPENGDLSTSVGTVGKPGADEELHELRKFLKLVADNNPNLLEALWIERLIRTTTPVWERIRKARDLFLSKKARFTFSGYCFSQIKRIETHRGYLLHPPSHKPTREEFGLPCETIISKENRNAILSIPEQWVSEGAREVVLKEKRYNSALEIWTSYCKWERERNPARKELERKYSYDTKHATHLIRLSKMCIEILRDGEVLVYRPDRDELRQILNGEWPYEKVMAEANKYEAQAEELYEKSPLRKTADHKGISELYGEICEEHYGIRLA